MSPPHLEIIVADPHPLFREALENRLTAWFPKSRIYAAVDQDALLELGRQLNPDLVICEMNLGTGDAFQVMEQWPGKRRDQFLILTIYSDPKLVRNACKAGALGYVLKTSPPEELLRAIHEVLAKRVFLGSGVSPTDMPVQNGHLMKADLRDFFHLRFELTKREVEVLGQIMSGLSNREIAETLFISEQTVCVHSKNILRKVGVNNTQKLLRIAYEHQLA